MKKTFILLILSAVILSCQQNGEDLIPPDLDGKKNLLKSKKQELKELNEFIAEITDSIVTQDPAFQEKKHLVSLAPIIQKDFNRYVTVQGSVVSDDVINVSAEVPGRISSLLVREGQPVKRAQLIATLDLESIQKQINELETSLNLATTVFERQKRLWDQNIGSEIQYLEAKNNKERLEKSLETLKHQLSKSKIYAPISGVVDREMLKQGEMASPGVPIVVLLNTRSVKIVADVPESYLAVINRGDMVTIYLPALGREIQEKVSLIGRTIDPNNRTFKVEVVTKNTDGLLKPNLLAELRFVDLTIEDALVIPLDLIQEEVSGKEYVFIKSESEKGPIARKKYIKQGDSYLSEVVITEGLQGDEQLIMEGSRGLTDSELIKIVAPR